MSKFNKLIICYRERLIKAYYDYDVCENNENLNEIKMIESLFYSVCAAKLAEEGDGYVIAKKLDLERLVCTPSVKCKDIIDFSTIATK